MNRCCAIVFVALVVSQVRGKSLIFNKYGTGPYGAKRQIAELDYDEIHDNDHSDVFGYKRSIDGFVHPFKRSIFGTTRKRSPYGLVYNQGKPIGILEPIGQAFEYASYPSPREVNLRNTGFKSQWYPSKRESDFDLAELERDDLDSLHNSNYANVLAKFKVNNKIKQRPYRQFIYAQQVKRDAFADDAAEETNHDQQFDPSSMVSSLSSTSSLLEETPSSDSTNKKKEREELKKRGALDLDLTTDQQKQDQVVKIDSGIKTTKVKRKAEETDNQMENLKENTDDLSFIEKDDSEEQKDKLTMKKREIYFEDEDLENGLNKIGLTKESHSDRNKKEDGVKNKIVTKSLKNIKKTKVEKSIHKKAKKKSRKEADEPKQRIAKSPKRFKNNNNQGFNSKITKIANYQASGEEYLRKKRQAKEVEKDDSEIMKGLEESGDLTVSGNKSPLVAVSNEEIEKKSQEKRDKEELEYEKRLERDIQEKINAIKEEVKREITKLQENDENIDDPHRRKREITGSNLMECESSILDPGINIEGDLEPHVRKRRGTEMNDDRSKINEGDSEEQSKELCENTPINNEDMLKSKSDESLLVNKREEANNEESEFEPKSKSELKSESEFKSESEPKSESEFKSDSEPKSESESKEKSLEKRTPSSSQLKEEEDKESNDEEEENEKSENEKETPMMKRNQKKEKEKKKKVSKIDEETDQNDEEKNVEKRNLDIKAETEKLANNEKSANNEEESEVDEESTEIIQKRNNDIIEMTAKEQTEVDGVIADANAVVKRNEEELTTMKYIIPREGLSPVGFEELNRPERNAKEGNITQRKIKTESSKRGLRSPEHSSSKPATKKEIKTKQQKRNTDDGKASIQELGKPAPSKSVILNEQEMGKDTSVEERSAKDEENNKGLSSSNQDQSSINQEDSPHLEKEENSDVHQNPKKVVEDNEELNEEVKDKSNDNLDVKRRRRSLYNEIKRNSRKKRDDSWNDQSNIDSVGYRADDGEIDEEDDEMQDDGFDDQTSNFVNKRNVEYDDLDAPDYPTYMERNKRNALRLYDDEAEEDESFDNFLFYPNKYSRIKRHDTLERGKVNHRNQRLRHKRLEQQKRVRNSPRVGEKSDISGLSEADIFGGLPQSYEGELSRFKRVKRSQRRK